MADEHKNTPLNAIFRLIAARLKRAQEVAAAAECCAAAGNHDGAFRILLDVEQYTYEATTLLNAASIIRRAKPDSKSAAIPKPVNTPPKAAACSSTNTNWNAV